jgi:NAD(P)-dependent dehydrogenase (short-subunit alcohol dehydrogenase family)
MPQVALVTGGASGIGRAACISFAEAECNVIVVDVDEAGGLETVQQVSGGQFLDHIGALLLMLQQQQLTAVRSTHLQ